MLSKEENQLLTQVGPGTPGGALLRRYWQPVALCEELPQGSAPMPVRLLGEDLVLFRDDRGQPGLLGLHCPHRGADLSYGRLEDGGLRCIYHGWLFNREGRCLEQPGEPAGSTFHERIRQQAYPCQELGGVIFAYLGPGQPPLLPRYEFLCVPEEQRLAYRHHQDCSYLQGNEGNLDPTHNNLLHHPNVNLAHLGDAMTRFRGGRGAVPARQSLELETTDFGIALCDITVLDNGDKNLRTYNFVLPNLTVFPGHQGNGGYSCHWHVPIDDHQHWKYNFIFNRTRPIAEVAPDARPAMTPDLRLHENRDNRYLQDRSLMSTASYSGIPGFSAQDQAMIEGMGHIQDRTHEHTGSSDSIIVGMRFQMLKAIRELHDNVDPPHVIRDPEQNHFPHMIVWRGAVPGSSDWREVRKRLAEGLPVEGALV